MKENNLIFLISQPRSGSTLLQKLISNHSKVYSRSEPWLMLHPSYSLKESGIYAEYDIEIEKIAFRNFIKDLPQGELTYIRELKRMYMRLYSYYLKDTECSHFLDKTPRYYFISDELQSIFPKSHFILLLRNPLAVLGSIINTWTKNNWFSLSDYKYDLFKAVETSVNVINSNKTFLIVQYERLISDPNNVLAELFKNLNLTYEKNIKNFYEDNTKWLHGDPVNVYKKKYIDSKNDVKWQEGLKNPQYWRVMYDYLTEIGSDNYETLGYSYKENLEILEKHMPSKSIDSLMIKTFPLLSLLDNTRECLIERLANKRDMSQKTQEINNYKSLSSERKRELQDCIDLVATKSQELLDNARLIERSDLNAKKHEVELELIKHKEKACLSITADLRLRLEQVDEHYEGLKTTHREYKESYNEINALNDKLESENEKLHHEYDDICTNNIKLQTEYDDMCSSNENLQSEYEDLRTENEILQHKYNDTCSNRIRFQAEYDDMCSSSEKVQNEYDDLRTENEKLQSKYDVVKGFSNENYRKLEESEILYNKLVISNSNVVNRLNLLLGKSGALTREISYFTKTKSLLSIPKNLKNVKKSLNELHSSIQIISKLNKTDDKLS